MILFLHKYELFLYFFLKSKMIFKYSVLHSGSKPGILLENRKTQQFPVVKSLKRNNINLPFQVVREDKASVKPQCSQQQV